MLHVALYEPEIPPNTGNIIRLCANANAKLHLIKPLGFELDSKRVRRAGLDYHDLANMEIHENFASLCELNLDIVACTTKATTKHTDLDYADDMILLFGPETRGLPQEILDTYPTVRIPMAPNNRSLNLSNAVAIVLYEALRQLGFEGLS